MSLVVKTHFRTNDEGGLEVCVETPAGVSDWTLVGVLGPGGGSIDTIQDAHTFTFEEAEVEKPKGPAVSRERKRKADGEEEKIAKDIGGKVQPGSGSHVYFKGDVRVRGKDRVESKTCERLIYPLDRRLLEKARSECLGQEKPAFVVWFMDRGDGMGEDRWVTIPYEDWLTYREKFHKC